MHKYDAIAYGNVHCPMTGGGSKQPREGRLGRHALLQLAVTRSIRSIHSLVLKPATSKTTLSARDMRFLSALLIGEIPKHSPVHFLNGVYGMSLTCNTHDHLCNVYIPYTAENISPACYLVQKMAEYLHIDYECDVDDIIDIEPEVLN